MKVAAQLNWKEWKFSRTAGPIDFRVAGNPDTAVAIKFFLYVNDANAADEDAVRAEFQPYNVDPARMTGTVNRLGFVFIARPEAASGKDLFVWIEARQKGLDDRTEGYRYSLEGTENFFQMSDGVTITF